MKKSLFLNNSNMLKGCLEGLSPNDVTTATNTDYLAAAALGYAVAALTEWPRVEEVVSKYNSEYDMFE